LFNALKKDSFIWNAEQEQAFLNLKQVMSQQPILALPDFSQPFILEGVGDSHKGPLNNQGKPA
jgi:hypothetical protein